LLDQSITLMPSAKYFADAGSNPRLHSESKVGWIEIRDWMKHESDNGKKPVKYIIFEDERFNVEPLSRRPARIFHRVLADFRNFGSQKGSQKK
jgi:hypothetical protein